MGYRVTFNAKLASDVVKIVTTSESVWNVNGFDDNTGEYSGGFETEEVSRAYFPCGTGTTHHGGDWYGWGCSNNGTLGAEVIALCEKYNVAYEVLS